MSASIDSLLIFHLSEPSSIRDNRVSWGKSHPDASRNNHLRHLTGHSEFCMDARYFECNIASHDFSEGVVSDQHTLCLQNYDIRGELSDKELSDFTVQ